MELTWISIAASLLMGLGALFVFVFAVKKGWFRNIEDTKYQVFWSELDDPKKKDASQEGVNGSQSEKK
ncbi:MAG: cbb3-type cytochrome oxidase assembly protein [Holophagaceae bacterium]|nr:cbb3-type cytochrome oxidase assembly protein [Holophagaceae bacterium]